MDIDEKMKEKIEKLAKEILKSCHEVVSGGMTPEDREFVSQVILKTQERKAWPTPGYTWHYPAKVEAAIKAAMEYGLERYRLDFSGTSNKWSQDSAEGKVFMSKLYDIIADDDDVIFYGREED